MHALQHARRIQTWKLKLRPSVFTYLCRFVHPFSQPLLLILRMTASDHWTHSSVPSSRPNINVCLPKAFYCLTKLEPPFQTRKWEWVTTESFITHNSALNQVQQTHCASPTLLMYYFWSSTSVVSWGSEMSPILFPLCCNFVFISTFIRLSGRSVGRHQRHFGVRLFYLFSHKGG